MKNSCFFILIVSIFCLYACEDITEFSVYEGDSNLCEPTCSSGQVCSLGVCVPDPDACKNGELRCLNNQPQICSEYVWKDNGAACGSSQICTAGNCTLTGAYCSGKDVYTCLNNAENSGIIYQCRNQKWQIISSCPTASCTEIGNALSSDSMCGECRNNDHQCINKSDNTEYYQICTKGIWTDAEKCKSSCDLDGCR